MYQGLLRSIPLFSALPDEELRVLSQGLQTVTHPPAFASSRRVNRTTASPSLTQGEIEITRLVDDTTERVLQTLEPGEYFGEMSLLFADSRRSA